MLWKIVFWWLFEEHYKWGKKNFLHGVRIQPRSQGFPAPAIFQEDCAGDEARSDCGRGVVHVHVYEKYFILAIKIIFFELKQCLKHVSDFVKISET